MRRNLWLTLILGVLTAGFNVRAESRKLTIQSKYDQFDLIVNGGGGTVNGKAADVSPYKEILAMLASPLENDCPPLKGGADVTVRESGQTRYVYFKQGVVSDGKTCLVVGGEGLAFFPVHRDFLIGPKHQAIALKSPVKVFRQGTKLFEIKKSGKNWTAVNSSVLLNWDFIERLENAMRSFDIRYRALPEAAHGKTKVIFQIGDKSYEFYQLTPTNWAVKMPGAHWLEATNDFSFWYDFDDGVIEDRFTPQIKAYQAAETNEARMEELQKLDNAWSPNLRELYHKIALDPAATPEMKNVALKRLRGKPSAETAGVMVKLLGDSIDEDLRRSASQILKITYPKGPIYNPRASAGDRKKVVDFWQEWWLKNQNSL